MVSREELLAQAARQYGSFLRSVVTGDAFFPLEMRIGKTRRAAAYGERAAELAGFRAAADGLRICVEWRSVNDPRFGPHERPERAYYPDEGAFLAALGKVEEVRLFRDDLALIRAECPTLETWLPGNVQAVVKHHGLWGDLLRVTRWFHANPRSGMYLRQIPVEGVDTKFFERHDAILDALLIHTSPQAVTSAEKRWEARHGLAWEQPLVRWRFLDSKLQAAHGFPVADLALPAPAFRALPLLKVNAVITENLRNFLVLPPLPNAVAVLGSGDAAALLAEASWMKEARILYWGDMDERGFAILGRLRNAYPQTESVMMDIPTLEQHRAFVGKVPPYIPKVTGLRAEEEAALARLAAEGLWLEQERLPFRTVCTVFDRLFRADGE